MNGCDGAGMGISAADASIPDARRCVVRNVERASCSAPAPPSTTTISCSNVLYWQARNGGGPFFEFAARHHRSPYSVRYIGVDELASPYSACARFMLTPPTI